jgi:hypothetical protein
MNLPPGAVLLDDSFGTTVINATDVATPQVYEAMSQQDRALISTFEAWIDNTRPKGLYAEEAVGSYGGTNRRNGGIFMRDRYITPLRPWDQMRLAYDAVTGDDIVAGVCETTESLAFSSMDFFALDADEQDVYNQIAAKIDLDRRMREIWRDLFITSQAYVAVWWETQTFKVRGKTLDGNQRRKSMTIKAPSEMSLLDPLKVVPVGSTLFGKERLAYIATPDEAAMFDEILGGDKAMDDEIVRRLVTARYQPPRQEILELTTLGVPSTKDLYLLNPDNVFRHTLTRPSYERLAPVRMKNVFELLDMKAQLRQMERAHLIGAALRVDQRIATPEGWKPIGAAQVGDQVFSVDGTPAAITGVYPQGIRPIHKVTFTDGAFTYCDPSHLWTVKNRWGRERVLRLDEIMAEGLFQDNGTTGRRIHRHRIPIAAPLELPEANLPLDPYLVGYMLGDGSLTQSMPKITCAEPEDDQPWRAVLPPGVSATQYEKREGFCNQYGLRSDTWHYNPVMEGLRAAGIWGMACEDKFIPDQYLWASTPQRWALLQGLCDSDGHSHQAGGVEFVTISQKLVEGITHLAQSLGGVAKAAIREPRDGIRRRLYRVWVSLPGPEAPFRIKRKVLTWKPRKCQYVRAIHAVEPVEPAEAVCIKIDREDGLFLTEGMLATHNTNFIIIITKGSDQLPAKPEELANLQNMVRTLARVPVLVGDHRLNVEIVTPKLDNTLKAERWNTIDSRISGRLLQLLVLGNYAAGAAGDDSIKLVKVIARGMESRRHMIKRSLERYVFKPLLDKNPELESMPKLEFHPRAIALDFDAAYASFLFDLRQANEISRETILNQFDLDEALEAELRKREMVEYDHIFQTQVPFSTPNPAIPAPGQPALPPQPAAPPPPKPGPPAPKPAAPPVRRDNGGGRRNGGGAAPGSGQGQPSRRRPDRQRPAASENGPVDAPIEGHGDDHGGTDDADDET